MMTTVRDPKALDKAMASFGRVVDRLEQARGIAVQLEQELAHFRDEVRGIRDEAEIAEQRWVAARLSRLLAGGDS